MFKLKRGFTLVELLIVMAIIGILASLGAGSYMTAQMRGRDVTRKSDLKQIANALELYYADHGTYPATNLVTAGSAMTDGKTTYFKVIPDDPSSNYDYVYRLPDTPTNQKYQLFAYLENTQDIDILTGVNIRTTSCSGGKNCNFAVTSANSSPTE
jgi:general secretion pathway protein G